MGGSKLDPTSTRGASVLTHRSGSRFRYRQPTDTTRCLAWLARQELAGLDVIDFGCGSGILAIAAIKLGARQVLALDIDEQALSACRSNMEMNAIDATQIHVSLPTGDDGQAVDLLVANILARPLIGLAEKFAHLVKPGGKILLSGILQSQLNDIQSAYNSYFELDPATFRDDWVCIGGSRL